jgi:hypothetical protein
MAGKKGSAFGLDFPFGLPGDMVKEDTWEDFIRAFSNGYTSPEEFREKCRTAAGGSELKRVTDAESHTPFSPYNIRLYRQTYYGIRDVLAPLVREGLACVLPMQEARPDRPWVLEICPASTLKGEKLYQPYKGRELAHRQGRERVLEAIEAMAFLSIPSWLRSAILDDRGGDALDSVLAAFAVFRTLRDPECLAPGGNTVYGVEGYVYI